MKGLLDELFDRKQRDEPPSVTPAAGSLASIDRRLASIEKLLARSNSSLGCITAFLWLVVALSALWFLLTLA